MVVAGAKIRPDLHDICKLRKRSKDLSVSGAHLRWWRLVDGHVANRQLAAQIGNVSYFQNHRTGQLSLNAEIILLRIAGRTIPVEISNTGQCSLTNRDGAESSISRGRLWADRHAIFYQERRRH